MTTGFSSRAMLLHGGREADHTQRPEPRGGGRPLPHQPLRTCQAAHAVVAQHGVLLPIHLRTIGVSDVTTGLARAIIPGGPPDNDVAPATLHGLDQGKKPVGYCWSSPKYRNWCAQYAFFEGKKAALTLLQSIGGSLRLPLFQNGA